MTTADRVALKAVLDEIERQLDTLPQDSPVGRFFVRLRTILMEALGLAHLHAVVEAMLAGDREPVA